MPSEQLVFEEETEERRLIRRWLLVYREETSTTTLRVNRARSEQDWNVTESQPGIGSKLRPLRTEIDTVRGTAPIPERPPVVTSVIARCDGYRPS